MEQIISDIDNIRLDQYLVQIGCYVSRGIAAKNIEAGKVFVNGQNVVKKKKLCIGDVIEYEPEIEEKQSRAQEIPLDIRYEDDHIMVISKQAGLVCHPAKGHETGTLVNALIAHCGEENLCNISGDIDRLGIVHRLDGDTSGLMLVAKTNEAGEVLAENMKHHTTDRHYKALIYGNMKYNTGKIEAPILRTIGRNNRPKMSVSEDSKAKDAITTFTVLNRFLDVSLDKMTDKFSFTLLDCKLFTGRTHQIRSHMEYIGFPVVGDKLYMNNVTASKGVSRALDLNRQFLHSYKIGFDHPITGKKMYFEDDLPQDLQDALDKLERQQNLANAN